MAPLPGPYSGTSSLALVARVSALSFGLVYGGLKLKYLQKWPLTKTTPWILVQIMASAKAKSHKKAEEKAHH